MGWFPDDISGGRLKKIVYFVYGKIKKNVYLPSFSYSVLLSQTFFSDGLKRCPLSQSPESAPRRTDGRRVPCRFLHRRYLRFLNERCVLRRFLGSASQLRHPSQQTLPRRRYVPCVGLVRPVQAHGDAVHIGDVECAPCAGSGKFGGTDGSCVRHSFFSPLYFRRPLPYFSCQNRYPKILTTLRRYGWCPSQV